MNTNEAKQIRIEEYLHSLGYNPVRRQGDSLWYKSPFRDEQEPSFKVNVERNLWYDFDARAGAGTSSHWRRSSTRPTACPTSWNG
jgi:hypothetical protein